MVADIKRQIWCLSKIPTLQALPQTALRSLANAAELREHPRKTTLYASGDFAEHVYFLHGGRVHALRESTKCRTINLGDFGPGDIFGESCLWTSDLRGDMAVTVSAALLGHPAERLARRIKNGPRRRASRARVLHHPPDGHHPAPVRPA